MILTDLKPENFMTYKDKLNEVKIIDLGGLSEFEKKVSFRTLTYVPPEFLLKLNYKSRTEFSLWSVGITLLEIILGDRSWKYERGKAPCSFTKL